jgi:subtilisin
MKAIDRAVVNGCDFINMSLGGSAPDAGVAAAIRDAYSQGVVCFAASGNDGRKSVRFPASESLVLAVSAMGRKGCFPPQSVNAVGIARPFGTDMNNFIADFSNIGKEITFTAPGVGIISAYPADNYAVMDGTSMACPAALGIAARLLSSQPNILALPRDQARADAIKKYLAGKVVSLGFGANFEGNGMLML